MVRDFCPVLCLLNQSNHGSLQRNLRESCFVAGQKSVCVVTDLCEAHEFSDLRQHVFISPKSWRPEIQTEPCGAKHRGLEGLFLSGCRGESTLCPDQAFLSLWPRGHHHLPSPLLLLGLPHVRTLGSTPRSSLDNLECSPHLRTLKLEHTCSASSLGGRGGWKITISGPAWAM